MHVVVGKKRRENMDEHETEKNLEERRKSKKKEGRIHGDNLNFQVRKVTEKST